MVFKQTGHEVINLQMFRELEESGQEFVLIDVSSTREFEKGHKEKAVNIPLAILGFVIEERYPDKKAMYVLLGACDNRAVQAHVILLKKGYENLKILTSDGKDACSL